MDIFLDEGGSGACIDALAMSSLDDEEMTGYEFADGGAEKRVNSLPSMDS